MIWTIFVVFGGIIAACIWWLRWPGEFRDVTREEISEFVRSMGWETDGKFVTSIPPYDGSVKYMRVEFAGKAFILRFSRTCIERSGIDPVWISKRTQKLWRMYVKDLLAAKKTARIVL